MTDPNTAIAATAALLQQRLGAAPPIAVLLGSGWGPLAAQVHEATELPYAELPAFPRLAVGGHAGVLKVGRIASGARSARIAVLAGRKHAYEMARPTA